MKPLAMFLACCVLTAAAPAAAQGPDCGPDCLGLYFDEAGTASCLPGTAFSTVTAWMILSGPTMPAIAAMSIFPVTEGPLLVLGVDFGSPVICEPAEPGAYCTAWSPPLPTPGTTVLGRITLFYTGTSEPATIGLRNSGTPADDRPWVVLPDGSTVPLNPSAGPGNPMAQIGGECGIVPAAGAAWGALKGLYR